MKIRKFVILLLLFSFKFSIAANIDSIEIDGLNTISRGTVLSYLPVEVGDEFNNDEIPKLREALLQTNFFSEVAIQFSDSKLKVAIKENPTIKYFEFKNYKDGEVLNEEIIENIKDNYSFNNGKIFINSNLQKITNQLVNLYQSNGYFETKIEIKSNLDEQNRVGIELIFDEGERATINSFRISGNVFFNQDDLLDIFNIGEADFFLINFFTEKDNFIKSEYESGIKKMQSKYFDSGFLDFQIVKNEIKYLKDDHKIDLIIDISEGYQYKLNNLNFISKDLSSELESKLRSFFKIEKGDFFDRSSIIESTKKISSYFENKGYAYTSVDSSIAKSDLKEYLDVSIKIDEGVKAYINRIIISGNNRTQDDVIRRKMQLIEGAVYSKKELDDSIKNIKRLGYFSNVTYDLKKLKNSNDKVDLLIDVEETKTGEISIGLSHANATGAAINAGISQNNILGTGNTLNANFTNSDAIEETSFYFKNPFINSYGHSASFGLFSKKIDAQNLDASTYSISESGTILGYGVPIDSETNFFAESRISSIDLTCGYDLKNLYEVSQCASGKDLDAKISLIYKSDSLNDFYFPTDGSQNTIATTLTFPGISDFQYLKFESNYKNYTPVFSTQTLKFSTRLNFAKGIGEELPFFKRYFEGGSSSVRGFDFNSLGAKYANDKPKGGEVSLVSSVALGSPLDFIGIENSNMRGAIFADAGLISEKAQDFDLNEMRSSLGLQFTWLTPIGPLGFNFAAPLIKKEGDKTETFSFDLGAKF